MTWLRLTLRRQHQDPALLQHSGDEALALDGNRTSCQAAQCICHLSAEGYEQLVYTYITRRSLQQHAVVWPSGNDVTHINPNHSGSVQGWLSE